MKLFMFIFCLLPFSTFAQDSYTWSVPGVYSMTYSRFIQLKTPLRVDGNQITVVQFKPYKSQFPGTEADLGTVNTQGRFVKIVSKPFTINSRGEASIKIGENNFVKISADGTLKLGNGDNIDYVAITQKLRPVYLEKMPLGFRESPEVVMFEKPIFYQGRSYNVIRFSNKESYQFDRDMNANLGNTTTFRGKIVLEESGIQLATTNQGFESRGFLVTLDEERHYLRVTKNSTLLTETGEIIPHETRVTFQASSKGINLELASFESALGLGSQALSVAGLLLSFIPDENPYAEVIGYDCAESEKAVSFLRCKYDFKLNPLNNVVNCAEVINFWVTGQNSRGKNVCAITVRNSSFRIESARGKSYLENHGYFSKVGGKVDTLISHDEFLQGLKRETQCLEFNESVRVFPESSRNDS